MLVPFKYKLTVQVKIRQQIEWTDMVVIQMRDKEEFEVELEAQHEQYEDLHYRIRVEIWQPIKQVWQQWNEWYNGSGSSKRKAKLNIV